MSEEKIFKIKDVGGEHWPKIQVGFLKNQETDPDDFECRLQLISEKLQEGIPLLLEVEDMLTELPGDPTGPLIKSLNEKDIPFVHIRGKDGQVRWNTSICGQRVSMPNLPPREDP